VHFGIEAFQRRIAVKTTQRGINEMLGVGWLPHQPCNAFDAVLMPIFDGALVMVIPSDILEVV